MPRNPGCRFLLTAEAFRLLLTLPASDRQALDGAFQALADDPFLVGDYQESDEDGRAMEVLLRGRFLLTYWAAHPGREVRIVRLERV